MREQNTSPNRLDFPISFLTTIKSIGTEEIKDLRDFVTSQLVLNLDHELLNEPEERAAWQNAINTLNDLCFTIDKLNCNEADQDVVIAVKTLQVKQQELIAVMEVTHG